MARRSERYSHCATSEPLRSTSGDRQNSSIASRYGMEGIAVRMKRRTSSGITVFGSSPTVEADGTFVQIHILRTTHCSTAAAAWSIAQPFASWPPARWPAAASLPRQSALCARTCAMSAARSALTTRRSTVSAVRKPAAAAPRNVAGCPNRPEVLAHPKRRCHCIALNPDLKRVRTRPFVSPGLRTAGARVCLPSSPVSPLNDRAACAWPRVKGQSDRS